MEIIINKLLKSSVNSTDIKQYQLLYCTDTKECFYDMDNDHRIQLGCTVQLESLIDRNNISIPLLNKLYIITELNKLYRYKNDKWIEITLHEQIVDIIAAAQELIPTTITKNNVKYAPKTTAKNVYMNDGRNVEQALKDLKDYSCKTIIHTTTEFVIASHNYQKIFNIPFPVSNYDLKRFPIIIIGHGRKFNNEEYTLTTEQLIFKKEEFLKDEIVTFIFNYAVEISDFDINATMINNVRLFIGDTKNKDMKDGDIWINTSGDKYGIYKIINGETQDVINPNKEGYINESNLSQDVVNKINGTNEVTKELSKVIKNIKVDYEKFITNIKKGNSGSFVRKTFVLRTNTNLIELPFNFKVEDKDFLMVIKNNVTLNQGIQYKVSTDGKSIICNDNNIWMGGEIPITFEFICFRGF